MILHLSKQIKALSLRRVEKMLTLSLTLAFLSEIVGFVSIGGFISALIMSVIWLAYYALLFQALRKMIYSFLTFLMLGCVAHFFFAIVAFVNEQGFEALISTFNGFLCIFIVSKCNRPIFFPKINWTEYDFRFRTDRRVKIFLEEEFIEAARLYDLRRGEGALQCFSELKLDEDYRLEDEDGEEVGHVRILSQRITLLGRPITHGIRILSR